MFFGIYPKPILEPLNNSVIKQVQNMQNKAINYETKERLIYLNSIGKGE